MSKLFASQTNRGLASKLPAVTALSSPLYDSMPDKQAADNHPCNIKNLLSFRTNKRVLEILYLSSAVTFPHLCGLVGTFPGYRTEMNCASCEVPTEFIYVM
jgi:hypothetical protein